MKPYIARDTGKPLFACGHPVAEDGSLIKEYITHKPPRLMDRSDFQLLCNIGYAECVNRQYFGVIDRVDRTRAAAKDDWNASADEHNQWDACDALERMKHMLRVAGIEVVEDELGKFTDKA